MAAIADFQEEVQHAKQEVEAAAEACKLWEQLPADLPCYRSADRETVACVCDFAGSVDSISDFICDETHLQDWVLGFKSQRVLRKLDTETTLYHRVSQVPNFPDLEMVFASRMYRNQDGSVVLVCRSVPESTVATQADRVRVNFLNYSFLLSPLSPSDTRVVFIVRVSHTLEISDSELRAIQASDAVALSNLRNSFQACRPVSPNTNRHQ